MQAVIIKDIVSTKDASTKEEYLLAPDIKFAVTTKKKIARVIRKIKAIELFATAKLMIQARRRVAKNWQIRALIEKTSCAPSFKSNPAAHLPPKAIEEYQNEANR